MFRTTSNTVSVTEPHPSVPKSGGYIAGGRGGAGNFKRYQASEITPGPDARGPASRVPLVPRSVKRSTYTAGRGGAGNMLSSSSYADDDNIFQFDEEMIRKRESQAAPIYHIGRGGAGNRFTQSRAPTSSTGAAGIAAGARKDSTDSSASEGGRPSLTGPATRRDSSSVLSIFSRRSS